MTRLTLVLFCPAFFAFWLITSFFSSWSKWWQRCCFSQLVQLTKIFVDFETSKVSRVVTSLPIYNLQRLFPTSKVARVVTSLPSGVVSSNSAPSWNQPLNKGFNKWWEKEKKNNNKSLPNEDDEQHCRIFYKREVWVSFLSLNCNFKLIFYF